jgi:hypothetical protein
LVIYVILQEHLIFMKIKCSNSIKKTNRKLNYSILVLDDTAWRSRVEFELRAPDGCQHPDGRPLVKGSADVEAHFNHTLRQSYDATDCEFIY